MSLINGYRKAVVGQYEAALATLMQCVDLCPEEMWNEPVAKNAFCESVFHALIFGDLYLGNEVSELREQKFHQEHPEIFRDYEELEDRVPTLTYDKEMVRTYHEFVAKKATEVLSQETEDSLSQIVGFEWLDITRAEMHLYNIRHIQHHAAQLILKLRLETESDPRWFRSGQ